LKGIFINLDRSSDRKELLLSQLDFAGLPAVEYQRFFAIEPAGDEPQLSKRLKSKGELGLFRSLASVLAQIGDGGFDDVVHVLEDDACFPAGIADAIAMVSRLMLSQPQLESADIVFLDYFLNRDLFAHVVSRRANLAPGSFQFLPAKQAYLACTGSFLVRRSSASYLSRLLSKILDSANSLAPVDLTLRALLRMGAVSGFLVVPLLGAPGWEQDEASTIQTDVDNAVRLSQRAHILLRLLASGIKSPPFWCAQQLEEMYGVASPLAPDSDANDFLFYFDSLRGRMLAF
jgi:GR25 family glycosyltransferase involved in LPS biosynthesis